MFTTVITFKDDSEDDDDGFDANNDDNDDVTKWRGRERGQIVFYYPSFPSCILWVYSLLYYPSFYVCIVFRTIHHSMRCVTSFRLHSVVLSVISKTPTKHAGKIRLWQIIADYCYFIV